MEIFEFFQWQMIWNYRELFLRGIMWTFILTVSGVSGGLVLGLLLGIAKLSSIKLLSKFASAYITFFRGTPLIVQILLIHSAVIPTIFGSSQGPIFSGISALILNSSAYIAEIFRAGIQSIDRGQTEAARSLGMTHGQTMWEIIIPQAFRRMIPPLGNEFIALLKDSSLLAVIAANELTYASRVVAGAYNRFWEPYLTVALLYLLLTMFFSKLVGYLEVRLSNEYSSRKRSRKESVQ